MKKLTKLLTIPLLLGTLTACGPKPSQLETTVKGITYRDDLNNIIQVNGSFLDDQYIKIGVVSDIEGAIANAQASAEKLKGQNVDFVILAGDNYENEKIRMNPLYPSSTDNMKEMIEGIKPYAQLGVPVFIIPGNHETGNIYSKSINKLRKSFPNIFDLKENWADLNGVNVVGMGGYHDPRFTTGDGFFLSEKDYEKAINSLNGFQKQAEPTIFVTHGPPQSNTNIDYVPNVGHVGDRNIETIMDSDLTNVLNIHGHIHEGGRSQDSYKAGLSINVASITPYNNIQGPNTGLITINSKGVSYSNLK